METSNSLDESNARLFMPLPEHRKCITSPRCLFVPLAFVHTTFLWHSLSLSLQSEGVPEKLLEDLMARGRGKAIQRPAFASTAASLEPMFDRWRKKPMFDE